MCLLYISLFCHYEELGENTNTLQSLWCEWKTMGLEVVRSWFLCSLSTHFLWDRAGAQVPCLECHLLGRVIIEVIAANPVAPVLAPLLSLLPSHWSSEGDLVLFSPWPCPLQVLPSISQVTPRPSQLHDSGWFWIKKIVPISYAPRHELPAMLSECEQIRANAQTVNSAVISLAKCIFVLNGALAVMWVVLIYQ